MQNYHGLWLPDGETHLTAWMNKVGHYIDGVPTYQYSKLAAALEHVRSWRVAVDVGAHVGTWSMHLARRFGHVHAFEPVEAHRECFRRNLAAADNVMLYAVALGAKSDRVAMHTAPTSSGDTWVKGPGEIPMEPLDSFALDDVDFVKIDCEGFELFVLQGAVETIARCRPTVIVEQKPGKGPQFGLGETDAVRFLEGLGYTVRRVMSGDYILTP